MDKRRPSNTNPELDALTSDHDDDEEVVFLQEWDQPSRRHKLSGNWRKDQTRRNWLMAAGVGVLMVLSTVGLMAVAVDTRGKIPEQLHGVWRTSTARYADAALGLQPHEIAFYNGRGIPDKYRIDEVRTAAVEDKIRYTVEYSTEEHAYTIQFLASRDVKPTLQLVSRPEMSWSRGNVQFGPADKAEPRQRMARADTASALTPLSPEFVACIKAASRARAAGQEPMRCTQPSPQINTGPTVAVVQRDTTVSLMEDLGAQRRNR